MCVEQVSPEGAKQLQKLRELKFEEFEYGGEVWWYHREEVLGVGGGCVKAAPWSLRRTI